MARCRAVSRDLVGWIDGELSPARSTRVRQHVAACPACAREAASLRAAIAQQTRALRAVTTATGVDAEPLWAELQRSVAAHPDEDARGWNRWAALLGRRPAWAKLFFRPMAVAGAVLTAIVILLSLVGGPGMILIPLGVESPPPALARRTELFKDYPLIQHLEALEYFDTVESVPLDDGQTSHKG